MDNPIRNRIEERAKTFKVGDMVNTLIYPSSEFEGEIISIDGLSCVVKNKYGEYTSSLILCKKLG